MGVRGNILQLHTVIALSVLVLSIAFDSQAQTIVDICSRTSQIQEAILAELPLGTTCATADSAGLAGITDIDASFESISSLTAGDFSGLTNLDTLRLNNNSLANLPENLFEGLTDLETLRLNNNSLTSLPQDLFDGLIELQILDLQFNKLTSLPENLFDHVTSPQTLSVWLSGNEITCLPVSILNNSAVRPVPKYQPCDVTAMLSIEAVPACGTMVTDTSVEPRTVLVLKPAPVAAVETEYRPIIAGNRVNWLGSRPVGTSGRSIGAFHGPLGALQRAYAGFKGFEWRLKDNHSITAQCIWKFEDTRTSSTVQLLASPNPVDEGSEVTVTAWLSAALSSTVTIPLTLTAGTAEVDDYGALQSIAIAGGQTTGTGTITTSDDDDMDDETFTIALGSLPPEVVAGSPSSVIVTITDNDVGALIAPGSVLVTEGGSSDLSVALSAQPSSDVMVTVTGHVGTDLRLSSTALTFTPTNWNTVQRFTLTAVEDDDFTDDQIDLTLVASGGGYAGVTHPVSVTITDNDEEPLSISIYNREVTEDATKVQLRVELNRPSDQVVIVQYATSDVTAEAGSDYTASRGIVIFDPNATRGVIQVEITEDTTPEPAETFEVTLSKPQNAEIAQGVGEVTILEETRLAVLRIEDEVAFEAEGRVRFTVRLSHPSLQPVSVAYRTQDGTAKAGKDYEASAGVLTFAPGTTGMALAVPLLRDDLDWREETFTVHLEQSNHARIEKAVAVATIRETVSTSVLAAYAVRFVRTASVQIVEALEERFRSQIGRSSCGAAARTELMRLSHSAPDWNPSLGELLAGCRALAPAVNNGLRVWARGAFRQFNGQADAALTLRAEVATGMFGMDLSLGQRWVAGLLLAHSRGDGSFAAHAKSGQMRSHLTGIYPYVMYQGRMSGIWVTGGYGRGQVDVRELEGSLGSAFGAMGIRGQLASVPSLELTYRGDILVANAEVARQEVRTQAYRIRLGLEGTLQMREQLRPYVEANVRQDGGSAETGIGLELGTGVRMVMGRLRAEVRTQGLVVHTANGFTEWGVSGSVQYGDGVEGWSLRVHPSWGISPGLSPYDQQTVLDATPMGRGMHRTEVDVGYGFSLNDGTARPVMSMTRLSQGTLVRLGGELRPWDHFSVSVFGVAHAHAAMLGELGLNVQGSLRY